MRDHQSAPAEGAPQKPDSAHVASAVGKTSLTEKLPPVEAQTASAGHGTLDDKYTAISNVMSGIVVNRTSAINQLVKNIERDRPAKSKPGLLSQLAGQAIVDASGALFGKIANLALSYGRKIVGEILSGGGSPAAPSDGAVDNFGVIQLNALASDTTRILNGALQTKEKLEGQLKHHKISHAHAGEILDHIANEMKTAASRAFQVQYDVSLAQWFSALAQASFGPNAHKDGSNLEGHVHTNPIVTGEGNFDSYGKSGGYIHLRIALNGKKQIRIDQFDTPGIPEAVWQYENPAPHDGAVKALGHTPLNALPGNQHLPMIIDLEFEGPFPPPRAELPLPQRIPNHNLQAVGIVSDEQNRVRVKLPSVDLAENRDLQGNAQKLLSQEIGKATNKADADQAAEFIVHQKIGPMTLTDLKAGKLAGGGQIS